MQHWEQSQMWNNFVELIKYGISGVLTTVMNFALFVLLEKAGMHYIAANIAAYLVAAIMNYILNKRFVFRTEYYSGKTARREFLKFFGVKVFALAADSVLFYVLVGICRMNLYVGRIGLSMAVIMATFLLNKIFVFEKES